MMDSLKNIAFRYKALSQNWRIIIPILLGLVVAWFQFSDSVSKEFEGLDLAKSNRDSAERAYKGALQRSQNIPALEESFTEVNQRMAYFNRKAPRVVMVDKFLGKISVLASESGVQITKFIPKLGSAIQDEKKSKDRSAKEKKEEASRAKQKGRIALGQIAQSLASELEEAAPPPVVVKVLTHTVELKLRGQFSSIATFLDRLRREDKIIHYPKIEINRLNTPRNAAQSENPDSVSIFTDVDVILNFYQGVI